MDRQQYDSYRVSALEISKIALWKNLIEFYYEAYRKANDRATTRNNRAAYDGAARIPSRSTSSNNSWLAIPRRGRA